MPMPESLIRLHLMKAQYQMVPERRYITFRERKSKGKVRKGSIEVTMEAKELPDIGGILVQRKLPMSWNMAEEGDIHVLAATIHNEMFLQDSRRLISA